MGRSSHRGEPVVLWGAFARPCTLLAPPDGVRSGHRRQAVAVVPLLARAATTIVAMGLR